MQEQTTKQTKGKFLPKKKKTKKGLIVGGVIGIAALALLGFGLLGGKEEAPQLDLADTTVLAYTDLQSTVSATGTVESAKSTTVYSMVSYPIMAVHVEVGDKVSEGDLLAELDDQSIRNQITSQEISLDISSQTSNQQVETARDNYENFKSGLDQGLNTTLNSARAQAETAYDNYLKAQTIYDRYWESLNLGENTTLINAEAALRTARDTLDSAQTAYEQTVSGYLAAEDAFQTLDLQWTDANHAVDTLKQTMRNLEQQIADTEAELEAVRNLPEAERNEQYNSDVAALETKLADLNCEQANLTMDLLEQSATVLMLQSSYEEASAALAQLEAQLSSAESALDKAELAYETQIATYNATLTTVDNTLADYSTNVETAWKNYQNAQTALAAAEKSVQDQLEGYENSLSSAQIGANKAASEEGLRQLQENLEDTRITAPCSGTVTAVYAEVGSAGSGLLFIIEDVDNLVVDTSVKGYDVGTVQTGMKVLIRSDATGSKEMEGILTKIAPTSTKNAMGQSDMTGDAVFAAEVEITSRDTGLRIGMEAQLDYIIAEEEHVLAVPYDAVYTDDAGQTCILIAVEQEDGRYLIQSLPVATGMDDDLDMVVSGNGVLEGLLVINEADTYLHLLGQTVVAGTGLHADLMSAMMGG